jgi:hypothetical protein
MGRLAAIYRFMRRYRDPLRPILHWQYMGWVIAVAIGIATTMPFADFYLIASLASIVAGLAAIGFWLCSDFLVNRRDSLMRRANRRMKDWNRKKSNYRLLEWIPIACLVICTWASITIVSGVKWTRMSQQVYDKIEFDFSNPPARDAADGQFTVTNDSSSQLAPRHRLMCEIRLLVGGGGNQMRDITVFQMGERGWGLQASPEAGLPLLGTIEGGGDATTESCLNALTFRPTSCADFT